MGHSSRGIYSYFIYLDKCSGGDYHLRGTGRAITPKPPPSLHTWLLMCVFFLEIINHYIAALYRNLLHLLLS